MAINIEELKQKKDFIAGLSKSLCSLPGVNFLEYEAFALVWEGNEYPEEFIILKLGHRKYHQFVSGEPITRVLKKIILIINGDSFPDDKEEYIKCKKEKKQII